MRIVVLQFGQKRVGAMELPTDLSHRLHRILSVPIW
jgi:hypothetical protein